MKTAIYDFIECYELWERSNDELPFNIEQIFYKRAFAHYCIDQHDEAIKNSTEFIDRCRSRSELEQSDLHKGLIQRGLIYLGIRTLDKALKDIDEAIELTKSSVPYYFYCRASVHAAQYHYELAEEDLKKGSSIDNVQDVNALCQKAYVLSELDRHQDAIKELNIGLKF